MTRQFCLVSTQFPICNCSVSNILRTKKDLEIGNWVEKRQNCLVHTTDVDKMRQFCLVHVGGVNKLDNMYGIVNSF